MASEYHMCWGFFVFGVAVDDVGLIVFMSKTDFIHDPFFLLGTLNDFILRNLTNVQCPKRLLEHCAIVGSRSKRGGRGARPSICTEMKEVEK